MSYTRLNLKEGDIFKAAHLKHIEDGIVTLESGIDVPDNNIDKFGAITHLSPNITFFPGQVAGQTGVLSVSENYNSFSFVINEEAQIYVSDVEKARHTYLSLAIIPSGKISGTRYRKYTDEDTLPTEQNPITVSADSTIRISVLQSSSGWAIRSTVFDTNVNTKLTEAIRNNKLILQNYYVSDDEAHMTILKRCGNDSKLFLGQEFFKKASQTSNYKCWRLGELHLYEKIGNEFCFYKGSIIVTGEWECAIKEEGAEDFVGGNAHGDEQLVSIVASLDGKKLDLNTNFIVTGRDLEILRDSILDRCNTPGDQVIKHFVRYHITTEGILINQTVEWLQQMTLGNSYLVMCPIAREYTPWAYIDTTNEFADISTAEHTRPSKAGNKGHYSLWGDNFFIKIEFECDGAFDTCRSFITNSERYNKVYHDFVGTEGGAKVAEVGKKITTTNFITYNYSE